MQLAVSSCLHVKLQQQTRRDTSPSDVRQMRFERREATDECVKTGLDGRI